MKLTIVRHGESNYNVKGLCNAVPTEKVYLTPLGVKQAQKVAEQLKKKTFDIFLVSEMYRSEETASIINIHHLRPMFIDDRINDRRSGMEDQSVTEWHKKLEETGDWFKGKVNDGESFLDVKKRVFAFLDELKKKKQFMSILIVTHLAIIKLIKAYFENLSDDETWKLEIDNCEILEFEF